MISDKETTLGQKIKRLRKDKGLTQEQLAILAKVSYTTLTKVENSAIKNPSFEIVASLAKTLKVSLDDLSVNKHE